MSSDYIIGVDEVGTGALAGPAFIGAVVVPRGWARPFGVKDSKAFNGDAAHARIARARVYGPLLEQVTAVRIVTVANTYIDHFGLRKAWEDAMDVALRELVALFPSSEIIIDGSVGHPKYKCRAIPKADASEPAVSAASVLAKVNRDHFMASLHQEFPYYDWHRNAGYGTRAHWAGMYKFGVSPLHRATYSKIKTLIAAGKVLGAPALGSFPK